MDWRDYAGGNSYDHTARRQQEEVWRNFDFQQGQQAKTPPWQAIAMQRAKEKAARKTAIKMGSDRIARGLDPRTGRGRFNGVGVKYEVNGEVLYTQLERK